MSFTSRWVKFFENPSIWWDNRGKRWVKYPDFKHSISGEGLWISSCPPELQSRLESLQNPPLIQSCSGVRASYAEKKCMSASAGMESHCEGLVKPRRNPHFEARNKLLAELKVCNTFGEGKKLHDRAVSTGLFNSYVASAVISMYARCGKVAEARKVLDDNHGMLHGHIVSWNAMILGYAQNGENDLALDLFNTMQRTSGCQPDARTFVAALKACASLAEKEEPKQVGGKATKPVSLKKGMAIHCQARDGGFESDIYVQCTLLDMYTKCCDLSQARRMFDSLPSRQLGVVAWNVMLLGYVTNGDSRSALELYCRMSLSSCKPNALTYAAVLKACANAMAVDLGVKIHKEIQSMGMETDAAVVACLLDFYAKCGLVQEAKQVFSVMPEHSRDVAVWNCMLNAYAQHADVTSALWWFEKMVEGGVKVNNITLIFVLTACAHAGLVEEGERMFKSMEREYKVSRSLEHYTCMVDLYGRANQFDRAVELVECMEMEGDAALWRTLLGACRKWRNVAVGRFAFDKLVSIDNQLSAPYVMMANVYASSGMQAEKAEILQQRKEAAAWRKPGQSCWTDESGKVHSFTVGRKNHPQMEAITRRLKKLTAEMKREGYIADIGNVFDDDAIEDEEKEESLCGHSEKLAIGCGLINSKPGSVIRISKNLRVCEDCHTATALISKIEKREIVCRDASRMHVFKDGKCSCNNYF